MRDEERGTRELPAERGTASRADGAGGPGEGGPGGPAASGRTAGGIDGIPEQARPHPEDGPVGPVPPDQGPLDQDDAVQVTPPPARSEDSAGQGGPPTRGPRAGEEARARGRATGGTMSEHERNSEDDAHSVPNTHSAPNAHGARGASHDPHDRSGARAMFVELRALKEGSPQYAELRNQLVRMHLPLVEHLARRFRNRGEPLDDLTQVATIGLIKSVDRFDPDRGVEFSTYATPTVVGEIKRHFRDKGWAVRVPRRLQELRLALTTATAELSQLHGRSPTVHELAEKLAISEEEVLEGLESANAYSTLSLDVPDTDDESPAVADTLGAEDEALEGVEYRESLKPLLEDLPPREKRILLLRFFGNMTQSQIAQEVGISQMHVSRLLARTLAQLREKLLVEE
ncbi:RNA polymerase sigma factor SigF [Streptomyces anandii]|uniref:RNA polymerase sigma factor SigF n=1 Tax=Streptomyces anandii TaxID=285454 RepID=UPI001672E658|nr:RNA polymerase sigma factor SigF [Streptomyces anandii]GGX83756.1 RNA polymerase sigma factor [Streptomyces anandii JCM 4720]